MKNNMDAKQLLSRYAAGERIFTRAKLSGVELRSANLERVVLNDANLKEADLQNVNFVGANLAFANLSGANLSGANLQNADLFGADLCGANLEGTNLENTELHGAKFEKAKVCAVNLEKVKLASRLPMVPAYLFPGCRGLLIGIALILPILVFIVIFKGSVLTFIGMLLLIASIPIGLGIEVGYSARSLSMVFWPGICYGCICGTISSLILFILLIGDFPNLIDVDILKIIAIASAFCSTISILTALLIYKNI